MTDKTTVDVLLAAKDKILDGWCQGHYAENAGGDRVQPDDPEAAAFCIMGAVAAVEGKAAAWSQPLIAVTRALTMSGFNGGGPATFNDTPGRTKWEVVAMLDDAIRAAKDAE